MIPSKERAETLQSWILSEKKRMDELPLAFRNNIVKAISPDQIGVINYYIINNMQPAIHFNHNKTKMYICIYN